jgi:hypothetical protein
MSDSERLSILRDYSAGKLGTRATIDLLGFDDFADLLIALAGEDLHLPRPADTPTLAAHRERATELLQPLLRRNA